MTFSSDVYRVTEGDAVTPELVLSHARSEDVTVHVESLGLGGPWDVTVPAGQTRQSFSIATSDDGKAAGSRVTLLLIAPSGHSDGVRRSPGGIADAVVTVEDKPSPPPTRISVTNPKISLWEGGTATIRVAIANPKPEAFTLDYTLSGISYSAAPFRASAADVVGGFGTRSITVPADATSVEIPIEIASDTTNAEGVEWFQVRLSTTASGVVFGEREVQVDIFDTYVYASFASASSRTNEQSRTHDVTVNLAAAPDKDITLRYSVNRVASTATADADYNYTALSGSVTVSAGATTATIPVTILDDSILEADETVVLTLTRGTGYELALDDNCAVTGAVHLPCQNQIVEHTLTIAANDGPTTVSFASASQKAVEGAGTRNVTVNLSHAPDADITLEYSVGGTATAGSDYTALSGTVTVSAGATTATIPVAIADDSDAEGEETVVLTLTGVEGLRKISPSTHTLTIAASDGPPTTTMASFAAASQSAGAETGTHNVTVNLNPAPTSNITLNYTMGGTATPDSDYTALSGTLAVSAGSAMATIPVTLLADNVQEDRETVVLTLTPGTGYKLADPGKHTLTFGIVPTVSFLLPVAVTEEGVGTYEAPVRLLPPAPSGGLTISFTAGGLSATPGEDFSPEFGTVTVPAGAATASIPITIIDDSVEDSGEWVRLRLQNHLYSAGPDGGPVRGNRLAGYRVSGTSGSLDLVITNHEANDLEGRVQAQVDAAAADGDSAAETLWRRALAAVRDEAPPSGLARLTQADAQAQAASHLGGDIELAALWAEIAEVIGSGVTDPPPTPGPEVTIAADAASVTEGESASFTLTATPAPAAALEVTVTVAADGDYGITAGTQTVTIPTTGSTTLTLATDNDGADEADGSVSATVDAGDGYTVGTASSGSVAITDDDPSVPEVTVAAGTGVTEGESASFTLTAKPAPAAALEVTVTIATTGAFGITAGERTVTIPTTGAYTLTLATTGDDADEPDGSVSVTVDAGTGYTVGTASSGSVAIADDDDAPAPATTVTTLPGTVAGPVSNGAVRLARPSGWTGSGKIQFGGGSKARDRSKFTTLRIKNANSDSFEVAWASREPGTLRLTLEWQPVAGSSWRPSDGDARDPRVLTIKDPAQPAPQPQAAGPEIAVSAGGGVTEGTAATFTLTATPAPAAPLDVTVTVAATGDYGITAGERTVSIPATGSATLTLATTGDGADEPDGSVSATVKAGSGYTVGSASSGSVAIADDDAPAPAVSIAAGSGVTEGTAATFTLTATPAPSAPLDVTVTVAASGDYGITAGERTVSVPTTGSATLTLSTTDDGTDEPDGSVTVTVDAGDGYTVGTSSSGIVAIADDDLPPPEISVSAGADVSEGTAATFTVTADRAVDAALTVTLDVTEKAGSDFVAAADEGEREVTILAGETSATLTVATADDGVDEPDGSVTATVDAGDGYTVAAAPGNAASVAVADNDVAASGPPVISVQDVTVREGGTAVVPVTLSPAPTKPVWLVYKSVYAPSGAGKGATLADFRLVRGSLRFGAGETLKHARVPTKQDSHDDGGEVFQVMVIPLDGAVPATGVFATVTIENDDPMPAAYLARFGRTVAQQALDGVAARIAATREPGFEGTLAGHALGLGNASADAMSGMTPSERKAAAAERRAAEAMAEVARAIVAERQADGPSGPGDGTGPFGDRLAGDTRSVGDAEALLGTAFTLTTAADGAGGTTAFWGRAFRSGFDGAERGDGTDVLLDGTVTTAMLGADHARGRWLAGLALARSSGTGGYRDEGGGDGGAGDGTLEATLSSVVPYAAFRASERLSLWAALGRGAGEVTLATSAEESLSADTDWSMAAAGLRGSLIGGQGSGPALALTSDALWTRTSSEAAAGMEASQSDVTRLRLGLEGRWTVDLDGGGSLTPRLEIGLRSDGGDAETGLGIEAGGGVAWSDPAMGVSLDVSGRTLLAHGNDDLEDWGVSASVSWDPAPDTKRGPTLAMRQALGGSATGGLDRLLAPHPLEGRTGNEAAARTTFEAAWGLPAFGGRFTGTPHAGCGVSGETRDCTVGWRIAPEARGAPDLSFGTRATLRESGADAPEVGFGIELVTRW